VSAHKVLLLEPNSTAAKRLQQLVESLGHSAIRVDAVDTAMKAALSQHPSAVLASHPDLEAVIRQLKQAGLGPTSLLVGLPAKQEQPEEVAAGLGADAFVVKPYRRENLASALHAALTVRTVRSRLEELSTDLERERSRHTGVGVVDPRTNLFAFEFFKKLLHFEIRQARRYGFPLSLCLISIDTPKDVDSKVNVRTEADPIVASAVRAAIRDVDMPVRYQEGSFLVFLPHTGSVGAEQAGRRILEQIRRKLSPTSELGYAATASVGISGLRKDRPISFARLIKDAQSALRVAQIKGGNRVVVRR
jgi:diguanylate cyclase (GGDEF)-like protein